MSLTTLKQQITFATKFAEKWQHETDERREKDSFWNDFFAIFGMNRKKYASFEFPVKDELGNTQFIDVFYKGVFLAEHKSAKKNLDKAREQAERYIAEIARTLPEKDLPEYYAVSDFAHFHLFRREPLPNVDNEWRFPLAQLPNYIERGVFQFMLGIEAKVREQQEQANIQAAEIIGKLHKAFAEQHIYDEHELRLFITRLLFLFFADDSLVFERNYLFQDFLDKQKDVSELGLQLNGLFEALNQPNEKWNNRQKTAFAGFEYVNGGLFQERLGEFEFTPELFKQLQTACRFDWSGISPEIFGTLFQSVMNADERRETGAHYTEADNIEKVINSLFLDDLQNEFAQIQTLKRGKTDKLSAFYQKIKQLTFLDPACGCGNFLIVAYDHLRQLEDDVIAEIMRHKADDLFGNEPAVQCHLNQFRGIEIDEFAGMIARVAMWLKNHQCNRRTFNRFEGNVKCETLPLKDEAHIVIGNSLREPWICADYIFGNPPFIGSTYQTAEQKTDTQTISGSLKNAGILDYVANWYVKAAQIMRQNPHIQTAFVSTNSITQGQQVEALWGTILLDWGFEIFFAHRTFQWTSQASGKAAVHCVIVGFRLPENRVGNKYLFDYPDIKGQPEKRTVQNINPYLMDAPNKIIGKRSKQISGEMDMIYGNKPTDGGNLILTTEEKNALIATEPLAENYIRPFLGAAEFINNKERWCLWFHNVSEMRLQNNLKQMPQIAQRIEQVKQMRLKSTSKQTQKKAATSHLFQQISQPESGNYLAIPEISSETREFLPIGYLDCNTIASNKLYMLPNATLYHFGILCSTMHNAFMRTVSGRLKSDFQYSNGIVYNNFPFPFAAATANRQPETNEQKHRTAIETAAQAILDAREYYRAEAIRENLPEPSLADLYKRGAFVQKLTAAHIALDKAVDKAYGYTGSHDDSERVAFLFARLK